MNRKNRLLSKASPFDIVICMYCGTPKTPHFLGNGYLETPYLVQRRKTCGKYTDCYRKFISGKGNPNYKGYMPRCIICEKRISYKSAKDNSKGLFHKYCRKHALESYKSGELHKMTIIKNRKQGMKMKGHIPEQLKSFLFQIGHKSINKLYFETTKCKAENCKRKPIARYLCGLHYQRYEK